MAPGAEASAEHAEVRSPHDGSLIATVEQADRAAADRALRTAHELYRDRDAWLPAAERIEILRRTAEIMQERRDSLATEAAREGGKPLMDSRVEADRAIDSVHLCIEHLRTTAGTVIPMGVNAASAGRVAFTQHEPIGVVLAFSAFNHPLNLIVHQVGPAIAAGCPVVVKPAAATPLSCMRFVEIVREAGLPEPWCQGLLTAGHDVAGSMVADPRVAFFTFIGSGAVGWPLRSELAPGARCALEHGGSAPVIFGPDADVAAAVPLLGKGGFYHAGQVCVSVQRVFAHRSVARTLADGLADYGRGLVVGDPTSAETEVGPLIREGEVTRVHEWVGEAAGGGAEVLCGGASITSRHYAPTVLFDPPADSRVMTEEVFGPVVCVTPYDDVDAAIAQANSLPFSFQASVFTNDLDLAVRCARRLDAAAVMINDHTAFRVDWMPFAGLRESGYGVGGIPHTMDDMRAEKMIVVRSVEL
ncbi:MAG: aldehyde dehydrogenase family protein [Planctomycetes bacterium]|nr:aldehyde dehydrogenase family protein [Planctomycetota bacterium]